MMEETKSFIEANYSLVEAIAVELLDKETLSGEEIMKIIGNTKTSEKSYPDGIMMNESMGIAGEDSSEVSV